METFLPSGMTKIGRRSLIAILILGGAWYYYHAIQKEHDDRVELAEKAKTEFEALGIPSRGLLASTHKLSNTKCNTSEFIAVYSTNESPLDICKHFIEYFPENDWQQNQRCMIVEQGQGGTAQPFTYVVENATKREIQYKDSFSAIFYPKDAFAYPHMTGALLDSDIVRYAKSFGDGFYFIKYTYQGPYNSSWYPCNDATLHCECADRNYFHSTFSNGNESHWER